jgi:2-iminobutanoate/2-iminopropanoate deaminase
VIGLAEIFTSKPVFRTPKSPSSANSQVRLKPTSRKESQMARRKSIHIGEFKHANPIPNACRIENLLMSGAILGRDPATGSMPQRIEDQSANMFVHMKAIVEAGGGTTSDIIKITVWLQDRTQGDPVNTEWLKMFPDEHSLPARHALQMDMEGGALVQCDFTAVID